MTAIRESVEELADRLALAVSELVTRKIISTVSESIRTADVPIPHSPPATNGSHKRPGRKALPPELKKLCSKGDGKPVLAKGLCRADYYAARRKLKAREALKNGGAVTPPQT